MNPIIRKNKKNNITRVGVSNFSTKAIIDVPKPIVLMKNSKYTVSLESYDCEMII